MNLRLLVVGLVAFMCGAGACSLNPQPLPPGQYDAAGTGLDASNTKGDSGTFGDAGAPPLPDDAGDAQMTAIDAGEDASDAEVDANAGDAAVDAVADSTSD